MFEEDEKFFKKNGMFFFSSYMFDFLEEFVEENIEICVCYLKCMVFFKQWFEMEIGIIGGEEDGVDSK